MHDNTRFVSANNAITLGITIKLLNISVNSHTKSLDINVPSIAKPRVIKEYTNITIFGFLFLNKYSALILPNKFQLNIVEKAKKFSQKPEP